MSGYGSNPAGPPPAPAPSAASGLVQKLLIAAIVGSALVFIGSFLDWGTAEMPAQDGSTESESVAGMDSDGMWTLISSLVAIALLAFGMVKKNAMIAAASVLPSVVTLIFGILNVLDPKRIIEAGLKADAPEGTTDAQISELAKVIEDQGELSAGIGLYLVLIGAVVALAAGAMVAAKGRAVTQ